MFSGLSARKNNRFRKQQTPDRTKFGRRFTLEPLEDRSLLSVSLGSPVPSSPWSYGQAAAISAVVVDAGTTAPPAQGAEVDLVNANSTAGPANPILVKGYTSDANGDVSFDLTALSVGNYNLEAEFTDSLGNVETSNVVPVAVSAGPDDNHPGVVRPRAGLRRAAHDYGDRGQQRRRRRHADRLGRVHH